MPDDFHKNLPKFGKIIFWTAKVLLCPMKKHCDQRLVAAVVFTYSTTRPRTSCKDSNCSVFKVMVKMQCLDAVNSNGPLTRPPEYYNALFLPLN